MARKKEKIKKNNGREINFKCLLVTNKEILKNIETISNFSFYKDAVIV